MSEQQSQTKPLKWTDIINKNPKTIKSLTKKLTYQGWAFVTLPPSLPNILQQNKKELLAFFNDKDIDKTAYHVPPAFGYYAVKHKRSFRIMTDERVDTFKIPDGLESFISLGNLMDSLLVSFCKVICEPLFGMDCWTVGEKVDLPLLCPRGEKDVFGMLDATYYVNEDDNVTVGGKNCEAHYDPGLFSLSVLSTAEGLQVYDPIKDIWFDAPCSDDDEIGELAVLWTGDAAHKVSGGAVQQGIHRVLHHTDKPRLAIWHELCARRQDLSYLDDLEGEYVEVPNIIHDDGTRGAKLRLNKKNHRKRSPRHAKKGKRRHHSKKSPRKRKRQKGPEVVLKDIKDKQPAKNTRHVSSTESESTSEFSDVELDFGIPESKVAEIDYSDFEEAFGIPESKSDPTEDWDNVDLNLSLDISKSEKKYGVPGSKSLYI